MPLIDYKTESGPEFEERGLALARSLHDPTGAQGAIMFRGKERDGLFANHNSVHAYEFTTLGTRDKAVKDGEKLAELLKAVGSQADHRYKSRTGWFVTRDEPSADQRTATQQIAARTGEQVIAISIKTLLQRLCNSESYIQRRDNGLFGSAGIGAGTSPANVLVDFIRPSAEQVSLDALTEALLDGKRTLLTGNFGAGKSHSLRELYKKLRRLHFRQGKLTPFPVHINLRDCAGLRTPAEILRRHAEEVGFDNPDGLISSWRAGVCVLLLDGFDEIVPTRWLGGAADLKNVRWNALSPIRRLVAETPSNTGIIVAGRSHYFSGLAEMAEALGFKGYETLHVPDFDETQLADFISQAAPGFLVPDWVPMRPLLLTYLLKNAKDIAGIGDAGTRASGWIGFFDAMCAREAEMFSGVRPETIQAIISRVALLARSRGNPTGPVDGDLLRLAYEYVNGVQPDDEGIQLLMRLPGLENTNAVSSDESRVFADSDLADTAYALDLAQYILSPYDQNHPLISSASWLNASGDLGVEVAVEYLRTNAGSAGTIRAAIAARTRSDKSDAVMADLVRIVAEIDDSDAPINPTPRIAGVYFEEFRLTDAGVLRDVLFDECLFDRVDFSQVDNSTTLPTFNECLIGHADGIAALPNHFSESLATSTIEHFAPSAQTTAGILQMNVDKESQIALTVLRKIFGQSGSARKEGALSRGLPLASRPLVPAVLDELVSQGWLFRATSGNTMLYVGTKEMRKEAGRVLDNPNDFRLH